MLENTTRFLETNFFPEALVLPSLVILCRTQGLPEFISPFS